MERRWVGVGVEVLVVVAVAALVLGQVLGQPILLGFVETGSMAPTLDPGDGFVAVPAALAGEPEPGDVVTFRAEQLNGGGLTTHRIVRETERGYVTRGDANPFPDQSSGEPPVKNVQIVAHALSVDGHVVVIPQLGTVVTGLRELLVSVQGWLAARFGEALFGTQGLVALVMAVSLAGYVIEVVRGEPGDRLPSRDWSRDSGVSTRLILVGLATVVVVAATAAMVAPGGTQEYEVVSAEFDSDRPTVVPVGESGTVTYPVVNDGLVPIHAYVRPASDAVGVEPTHVFAGGRSQREVTVTLSAPDQTGAYRRYVVEHRYLAVLPEPAIRGLAGVHPWLPVVVIDALLGGGLYAVGAVLLGDTRARVRRRESDADGSLPWRLLRSLYDD